MDQYEIRFRNRSKPGVAYVRATSEGEAKKKLTSVIECHGFEVLSIESNGIVSSFDDGDDVQIFEPI